MKTNLFFTETVYAFCVSRGQRWPTIGGKANASLPLDRTAIVRCQCPEYLVGPTVGKMRTLTWRYHERAWVISRQFDREFRSSFVFFVFAPFSFLEIIYSDLYSTLFMNNGYLLLITFHICLWIFILKLIFNLKFLLKLS